MAEPPNFIRFPQTADHPFLMCLHCRNHVMSFHQNPDFKIRLMGELVICSNPVNVMVDADTENKSFIRNQPVVAVFCNRCNRNIGKKFLVTGVPIREPYVEEGKFVFHMGQTLIWNGKQLIRADTSMPVEEDVSDSSDNSSSSSSKPTSKTKRKLEFEEEN